MLWLFYYVAFFIESSSPEPSQNIAPWTFVFHQTTHISRNSLKQMTCLV